MIDVLRPKIRALVGDISESGFETFVYRNANIFTIAEDNITAITKVLLNGAELGTGEYSFDSTTNKITIEITGIATGAIIEVDYTHYKYSDAEIIEYVRGALVWISWYSSEGEQDYEIENNEDIYPTPDNKTLDLVALVASIMIKPDYSEYRLPNVSVKYPRTMAKEDRIEALITRFNRGLGITDVLKWD